VYAYILDTFADGNRLLVFEHVDFPESGIQVPGGSVEPGVTLTAAVSDKQINQQNNSHCHQDLGGKVHTGPPFFILHEQVTPLKNFYFLKTYQAERSPMIRSSEIFILEKPFLNLWLLLRPN
jgi:hypothetical protein